jgi:Cu(I)/Ag(I) efflux system membrane fusion protein
MTMRERSRSICFAFLLPAVLCLAGLVFTACGRSPAPAAKTDTKPGEKAGPRKILFYRSPMNPAITSEKPAKDEMGMDYVPVYEGEAEAGQSGGVEGRSTLTLSPEKRRTLGVQTALVRRTSLQRTIRTVGTVTADERLLHHIHTKFDGYVEHLNVNFTGQLVRRGEPLLSIYSPELVATQQEYLLAYRAQARLAGSPVESAARGASDLLDAARQRLLFWDIRPEDIARIEKTGQVLKNLDLYSEVSGYVVQKMAFHGMRVTPADTLFDIVDLSHLWVLADVYESDLSSVRVGMSAEITVPFLPGKTWRGPVTFIAPTVEEKTRTIKVRVEVDNAGNLLKPDMFADVLLKTELGLGLSIPEGAVLAAGDRKIAFVDHPDGSLEPREVQVGPKVSDGVQILSGLAEGESVITSANFLIDSESSLKAALSVMAGKPPTPPAAGAGERKH